jgi:hypothetical protein
MLTGDTFRLELPLPNGNWLPLQCKVLYKFEDYGIGAKFIDITRFEQELVGKIISVALEKEGLPMQIDPFAQPPKFVNKTKKSHLTLTDSRQQKDEMLQKIMSSEQ